MRDVHRHRVIRTLWAVSLLVAAGCGRDAPTSPAASSHVVAGPVVLVGYFTDASAHFTGTRVLADADGVPVELLSGSGVLATTATARGRYTFSNVPDGSYIVRTRVTPEFFDLTLPITVAGADVAVRDTLKLASRGDLFAYPNPFQSSVAMSFNVLVSEQSSLRVLDRSGRIVKVLIEGRFPVGVNRWTWNGTDATGAPVPAGFYWLTFPASYGESCQLLFRQ